MNQYKNVKKVDLVTDTGHQTTSLQSGLCMVCVCVCVKPRQMLQWFLYDASGSICLSVIEHVFVHVCVCVYSRTNRKVCMKVKPCVCTYFELM